jgi:translation initiation factor IF-2
MTEEKKPNPSGTSEPKKKVNVIKKKIIVKKIHHHHPPGASGQSQDTPQEQGKIAPQQQQQPHQESRSIPPSPGGGMDKFEPVKQLMETARHRPSGPYRSASSPGGARSPHQGSGRPSGPGGPIAAPGKPGDVKKSSGPARRASGGRKYDADRKYSKFKDDYNEEELRYHKRHEEDRQRILPSEITILEHIPVGELARKLNIKVSELIKKLMDLGVMATITDVVDADTATIVCDEYKVKVKVASLYEETLVKQDEDFSNLPDDERRDPIVTVMGHVDHGKTQLLDTIRNTNVIATESGAITQHIGAYKVFVEHAGTRHGIVFLDTPGHEAFSAMRARGAEATDIVVLVVAADDGVMPQTLEALNHAKAANVPVIVAINKIDLPTKNVERIKQDLSQHGIQPEEWGGQNMFVEISAKMNINIDKLLEAILLQAEMLELKANSKKMAEGLVVESRIDPGFGPMATVLIKNGTLRVGEPFVAGVFSGRIRIMTDDRGNRIEAAGPATPVAIYGMEGTPAAGDPFQAVKSDKYAKQIADKRQELARFEETKSIKKVTLSNFMEKIKDGEIKELNLILKTDVKGSQEALEHSFNKLSEQSEKVKIKIVHSGAGAINESDVQLAVATQSVIIGFHVRPNAKASDMAKKEKIEIRTYEIIYDAIEDMKAAMEGLLDPTIREEVIGKAEIRETFKISKVGTVAGCMVVEGKIQKNSKVRLIRDSIVIATANLASLKRFKDDAKEVGTGLECGIMLENFNDLKAGDMIECFVERKEVQKLFKD